MTNQNHLCPIINSHQEKNVESLIFLAESTLHSSNTRAHHYKNSNVDLPWQPILQVRRGLQAKSSPSH